MATSTNIIKSWFTTGKFPSQAQFWAWIDSFRHKDDMIPVQDINGLNDLFTPINNHFDDDNAHSILFKKTKIHQFGDFQIFKAEGNFEDFLETGDFAAGFINGSTFMPFGKYLGVDPMELGNWITNPLEF